MRRYILLIDDDEDEIDFFKLAEAEMPGIFYFTHIDDPLKAAQTIEKVKPDLVF